MTTFHDSVVIDKNGEVFLTVRTDGGALVSKKYVGILIPRDDEQIARIMARILRIGRDMKGAEVRAALGL